MGLEIIILHKQLAKATIVSHNYSMSCTCWCSLWHAWYGSTMPTDCQSWLRCVYHELLTALFPGHNFRWRFTWQPISPSILHYGLQTEPERENYWWTGMGSMAIIHLHRQDWSRHQIISWSSRLVPCEWYPIVRCLQWSLYQGTDMQWLCGFH